MNIASFGSVLAAMSGYMRDRAESRGDFLGKQNTELLYALSHTFAIGAQECLKTAEEEARERA